MVNKQFANSMRKFPTSLTFKAVFWAAATWEFVSPVVWNRLNPKSRFHEQGAGYIGTYALIGDTTVIHSVLHQNGIFWAVIWLHRTAALHAITRYDDIIWWHGDELVTYCGNIIWGNIETAAVVIFIKGGRGWIPPPLRHLTQLPPRRVPFFLCVRFYALNF